MSTAVLELKNISRRFGRETVINTLNLQLDAGQVVCLLGPSGCGKSTTLRIAAGVERQDEGMVFIDGQKISCPNTHLPPELRKIGLMFQDFALFPHLSVADNVTFASKTKAADKRNLAEHYLKKVDLVKALDKYPHQLSGGEQQRVALVRALAARPKIMLMDEPFSGLDNRLRDDIRDETLALLRAEGTSVLMVTHDPEEAMRMSDRIDLMRNGQIIQSGAPYTIYTNPVDKLAAAFFSDLNIIKSTVHGARADTPFGQFLTPGHDDGTPIEIIVRPQHLHVEFDRNGVGPSPTPQRGVAAKGVVERARFLGNESLVEFRMDYDGSLLKVIIPSVFLPEKGLPFWLTLRRDRCHIFPS